MISNNTKRAVSLMLFATMAASLAACGNEPAETTAVTTAAPVVSTEPEEIIPDMPDDLMFEGGKIRILGMERLVEGKNGTDEESVSVLAQELHDRNKRTEERFGITIEFTDITTDWSTMLPNAVRQSVNSGSADYDVVFGTCSVQVPLVNEGMYLPITELPWVNLEKPWWNQGYIESVSFHQDSPYALFGNLTYNQVERTTCVFANTTKLEAQHNIVADDLYKLVDDGEWTIDKFTELVNLGYKDENGDTKKNAGDMFGMVYTGMGVNFMAYGAGLSFTTRDEDGYPALALNNERSIDLADKLVALFCNNQNVMYFDNHPHVEAFGAGQALFMPNRLCVAGWTWVREMKDDFILLPYPKYNADIDGYHSAVENNVQWGCLAMTVADEDLEMISAAMEQMCYDGYNTVTPLYYENDLKLKYTRGDDIDTQSRMIDLIVEGARTDYLLANDISGLSGIFHTAVNAGQNNFASYYAQREVLAAAKLRQMIEKYEDLIYN